MLSRVLALGVLLAASGCSIIVGPATFGDRDGGDDDDAGVDGGRDAAPPDSGDSGDGSTPECGGTQTRACPGGIDVGECVAGTQRCMDGMWGPCEGAIGPTAEVCDGLDNDCDGTPDGPMADMACGSGQVCTLGRCMISSCPGNFEDCNLLPGDGCETDIRTSRDHCGGCGMPCGWRCTRGTCNEAVDLGAGLGDHTCAVRTSGDVVCWGRNMEGQLGIGSAGIDFSSLPLAVLGEGGSGTLADVEEVVTGGSFSCARRADRTVVCWGSNTYGQLGNGSTTPSNTPVRVTGLVSALQISAGKDHACALVADMTVRCWGRNLSGQLGDGTTSQRTTPVTAVGVDRVTQVSGGGAHTCVVRSTGAAECWGSGIDGQLGQGSLSSSQTHVAVSGLTGVASIAAGDRFTCATLGSGSIYCWGSNTYRQVSASTTSRFSSPVEVPIGMSVTQVSAGTRHACATLADGTGRCWGSDEDGRLGDGTGGGTGIVIVTGLSAIDEISAAALHSCALQGGGVYCWGSNIFGRLGSGDTDPRDEPALVAAGP